MLPLPILVTFTYFLSTITAFYVVRQSKTWYDAQTYCQETYGTNLVTITDATMNERVRTSIFYDSWIGFTDAYTEDEWEWIGYDRPTYTNWASSEPNNAIGGEDCAVIYGLTGTWNDRRCSDVLSQFICAEEDEYDEFPTGTCDCYSMSFMRSREAFDGWMCYRYTFDACDTLDSFIFGAGNADRQCNITSYADIVWTILPPKSSFEDAVESIEGLKIAGIQNGDEMRICMNKDYVDGSTMSAGRIQYNNIYGDSVTCRVPGVLPALCPNEEPNRRRNNAESINLLHLVGNEHDKARVVDLEGKEKYVFHGKEEQPESVMMTYVWCAVISMVVSMCVVCIGYMLCIKPMREDDVYVEKLSDDYDEEDSL